MCFALDKTSTRQILEVSISPDLPVFSPSFLDLGTTCRLFCKNSNSAKTFLRKSHSAAPFVRKELTLR